MTTLALKADLVFMNKSPKISTGVSGKISFRRSFTRSMLALGPKALRSVAAGASRQQAVRTPRLQRPKCSAIAGRKAPISDDIALDTARNTVGTPVAPSRAESRK